MNNLLQKRTCLKGIIYFGTVFFLILVPAVSEAQTSYGNQEGVTDEPAAVNSLPSLFIDCTFCDDEHIRREIPFINYVRDPEQADIHLFVTRTRLSLGGAEYEISFIGRRHFAKLNLELSYTADRNETWSETRDSLNNLIRS